MSRVQLGLPGPGLLHFPFFKTPTTILFMASTLPRILLVDDEPENLKALERTLRGRFDVTACVSAEQALEALSVDDFAVVVSDQRMPGMLGTDLLAKCAKLKPFATRVILTAYTEIPEILDAINRAEIYRYITKPWNNTDLITALSQAAQHHELNRRNRELVTELQALNQSLEAQVQKRTAELTAANERLSELAATDPLTKVFNRRAFLQKLNEEIERSRRYKHKMVLVMIDVDHFKTFNDMEGHVYGDEALRKISALLTSNLRKTDVLARYGGEEFVLIMPETTVENGTLICERLRQTIETTTFQGRTQNAYLTVSIGLAEYPEDGDAPQTLIDAADHSLYQAKSFGRNRVVYEKAKSESFFVT